MRLAPDRENGVGASGRPSPSAGKSAGLCPLPRRGGGEGKPCLPAAVPRASSCRRFRVVRSRPVAGDAVPGLALPALARECRLGKGRSFGGDPPAVRIRARATSCLRRQSSSRGQRRAPLPPLASPAGARQCAEPGPRRRRAQRRCLLPISYCQLPTGHWLLAIRHPPLPQLIHASRPRAILALVPLHRGRASKAFRCGGGIGRSGNHCGHAPHILGGRRDPCSETGGSLRF